jgi:Ni,Fe-hydrogenase III small subunit
MATMVFERSALGLVMVVGNDAPSDGEWDAYVADIAQAVSEKLPPRSLVYTAGGAPTPAQRMRLEKVTQAAPGAKVAILVGSTFARGVVNAFALFDPGYRAFAPKDVHAAMDYLGASPTQARDADVTLMRLRMQLGVR